MLASAKTFTLDGLGARPVVVEVDVHRGLPAFSIVGLPDAAVRESRERVRSAIVNIGLEFPLKRVTVNLAPADVRKAGPGLDLAIAGALLAASGQIDPTGLDGITLAAELALDGTLRPVPGILAMALAARDLGIGAIAVTESNAAEAALVDPLRVLPLRRLDQLGLLADAERWPVQPDPLPFVGESNGGAPDLSDLRGQPFLRRVLEVAAAGGHSILMIGPPGSGKSLAARRLPSILPPLDRERALEVALIASVCGRLNGGVSVMSPFRAPHHTVSAAGLVGGGSPPRPGEVTLAHRGVLFLDELGEFSRGSLEALRGPLEDGSLVVSRSRHSIELPCRFLLVAAANPCPCGRGEDDDRCSCGPAQIGRYQAKLSGAVADRIDISVAVSQPDSAAMGGQAGETSETVRERVIEARALQQQRLGDGRCNAEMTPPELRALALTAEAAEILESQYRRLGLSGRGHDRVLRLARTVADLESADRIGAAHVHEALSLRTREPVP